MPEEEKPKYVTHTHTHTEKSPTQRGGRLLMSSYPVLLILLLVLGIGVHVGAHAGVAGGTVDAADAVGGVLPPDSQVRLPVLLLLLLTAVRPS